MPFMAKADPLCSDELCRSSHSAELTLDRAAIGLSALCIVHCVGTLIALTMMASIGGVLTESWVHELGLGLAIMLGAGALGLGYRAHRRVLPLLVGLSGLCLMLAAIMGPHGWQEALLTIIGASLLAGGHFLNVRARR